MKRFFQTSTWLSGMILISAMFASGQGMKSRHMRMYDPATETTFKGTIEAVSQPSRGQMMGTHLTVKAGENTHDVMLGPSSFIASQGFTFEKGDSIEVTGSKVTMGGTEYVIAREVIKGEKTLTLRDKDGVPKWAGQGQRGPMNKPQ